MTPILKFFSQNILYICVEHYFGVQNFIRKSNSSMAHLSGDQMIFDNSGDQMIVDNSGDQMFINNSGDQMIVNSGDQMNIISGD